MVTSAAKGKGMMRRTLVLVSVTLLLASCASAVPLSPQFAQGTPSFSKDAALGAPRATAGLSIPPRLQWMGNFGYCGETSLISAGLYYGQYVSQYQARAIASSRVPQYKRNSQLLLGVNDQYAATKMHLTFIEWDTLSERRTSTFLAWVKRNVELGYPVTIGVFTNEYRFYGKTAPNAGDSSYDHIVPVTAVRGDTLTFSDNGLWSPSGDPKYSFTYQFGSFQRTRAQANARNAPVYSLSNNAQNYGIAITGVADRDHDTLPVRLVTNVNVRPAPMPLLLTITVSNLKPGTKYVLYRYDRFPNVPDSHFNAHAASAAERLPFQITAGNSFATTQRIMSDDIAVYRAVPASAP
jgi:hypothetical protein